MDQVSGEGRPGLCKVRRDRFGCGPPVYVRVAYHGRKEPEKVPRRQARCLKMTLYRVIRMSGHVLVKGQPPEPGLLGVVELGKARVDAGFDRALPEQAGAKGVDRTDEAAARLLDA